MVGGSAIGQVEWALVLDSVTFLSGMSDRNTPTRSAPKEEKKARPIDLAEGVRTERRMDFHSD